MFSFFTKSEQTENEKKLIKQLEEALTENNILKLQIEELLKDKSSTEDNAEHITLPDLTQYKESLKNILNLADIMEIDGNHSDLETRQSWVTQITQSWPQL
jgi:hypothetical protein